MTTPPTHNYIDEKVKEFDEKFKNCYTLRLSVIERQKMHAFLRSALVGLVEEMKGKIESRATDKAEILKNEHGYGNIPILFEKSEIISLLDRYLSGNNTKE